MALGKEIQWGPFTIKKRSQLHHQILAQSYPAAKCPAFHRISPLSGCGVFYQTKSTSTWELTPQPLGLQSL